MAAIPLGTWLTSGTSTLSGDHGTITTTSASYQITVQAYQALNATDFDLYFDLAFPVIREQYLSVAVRASQPAPGASPASGYGLQFFPANGSNTVGLERFDNASGPASLSGDLAAGAWSAGVARHVRLRVAGSTIQAKVWDGSTEPATWLGSATDTTFTSPGGLWLGLSAGSAGAGSATFSGITITDGQPVVVTPTIPAGTSRLPKVLHAWAPILRTGTSALHSLGLIRSTGTGQARRSGVGSAFVLTALSTAAAGFKSTAGEGHYAERPITLGEATGARPYEARLGYGAEHPLTLPTVPGVGHKSTNGFGVIAVRPLTLKPASGLARMRGRALALMLPLALRPAAGSKGVTGSGGNDYRLDASLLRSAPGYPGVHREWHLTPPITTDRYLLEPLHSRRLAGANDYGHTLTVGDRVYPGGGVFQLTDAERAELIDAGYGDLLSLKDVR